MRSEGISLQTSAVPSDEKERRGREKETDEIGKQTVKREKKSTGSFRIGPGSQGIAGEVEGCLKHKCNVLFQ
jgi:hypothetical protein